MSTGKAVTIAVGLDNARRINALLQSEPASESECFGEDETIVFTARFDDEYEADIKVCGVQYEEGGCNTAWTEAVLFKNGSEVCCTEPEDTFFGTWEMEHNGQTFVVHVI